MIILSPAKTMKLKEENIGETIPTLNGPSLELRKILLKEDLATVLKINGKVLDKTNELFKNKNYYTAINSFDGLVFKQINTDNKEYLKNNVFIMSGMYGIINSLDCIMPYRLDYNNKVNNQGVDKFWSEHVNTYLGLYNPKQILNLSSKEYSSVIEKCFNLIDVNFLDEDGKKLSNTHTKMFRGILANYCIENNVLDYSNLDKVNTDQMNIEFKDNIITVIKKTID